jgi:hypothetical protein
LKDPDEEGGWIGALEQEVEILIQLFVAGAQAQFLQNSA